MSSPPSRPALGRRAAVLGSPITHSLSPVLHRAAYAQLGLDWRYDAIECDEAGVADFLDHADEFAGLSLTMPLKRAVVPFLDDVSPLATAVGAVNTVTFGAADTGGRRSRRGDNTDVPGMVGAIRAVRAESLGSIVVLGAGGTAAAAVAACRELGSSAVRVVVRDRPRAAALLTAAENLAVGVELVDWPALEVMRAADVVISTVPAGAADHLAADGGVEFGPDQLLFDALYHPWPTALAVAATRAGAAVIGGLELLVRQAGFQVELMTGRRAPLDEMRSAGLAALAARS